MPRKPKSVCKGKNQDGSPSMFHSIDYGVCQNCGKSKREIDREQGKTRIKRRYAARTIRQSKRYAI